MTQPSWPDKKPPKGGFLFFRRSLQGAWRRADKPDFWYSAARRFFVGMLLL
jgi:hypothetical protein